MQGQPKQETPKRKYKRKRRQLDQRKLRHHPEIPGLVSDLIKDFGTEGTKNILKSIRKHKINISFE